MVSIPSLRNACRCHVSFQFHVRLGTIWIEGRDGWIDEIFFPFLARKSLLALTMLSGVDDASSSQHLCAWQFYAIRQHSSSARRLQGSDPA